MDMTLSDRYSEMFQVFHLLPSYHNNKLFTDEIESLMKFTINCKLNLNNRVVFSFVDRHIDKNGKDRDAFVSLYEEIHRISPKKDYKENSKTREKYPKFGYDFENDLSPETIFRMMNLVISRSEQNHLLSCFILKILDEVESMASHFNKLANQAYEYKDFIDEIYDESL